jgi:Nuclease-related domain
MLLLVVLLSILLPLVTCALYVKYFERQQARYINPLTKSLRRPPGAQLARELGGAQLDIGFGMAEILLPMFIPIVGYFFIRESALDLSSGIVVALSVLVWLAMTGYGIYKFVKRLKRIRILRLAYECELAVGQELDLLMLKGYRVFHDVPADEFNIDHMVIGPAGVFAVETKGRSKSLSRDDGKKEFRVVLQKGRLNFPNYSDDSIIPQAVRQARWASSWLSESVGDEVAVTPVVILPGWYVELKEKSEVPVLASGFIDGFFGNRSAKLLSDSDIQRITYQIDRQVRDLEVGEVVRPLP